MKNEDLFRYRNTIFPLLQLMQYREWKVKIGTRVLVRQVSLDPLGRLVWYGRYAQPSRGLREDGLACGKVHTRARGPVEIESFVSRGLLSRLVHTLYQLRHRIVPAQCEQYKIIEILTHHVNPRSRDRWCRPLRARTA